MKYRISKIDDIAATINRIVFGPIDSDSPENSAPTGPRNGWKFNKLRKLVPEAEMGCPRAPQGCPRASTGKLEINFVT